MDILILTVAVYCVVYVKIKIQNTTLKLLYMIDYLFLMTLNEIITCGKIQIYTHKQSWDMDILFLTIDVYCALYVKIKI